MDEVRNATTYLLTGWLTDSSEKLQSCWSFVKSSLHWTSPERNKIAATTNWKYYSLLDSVCAFFLSFVLSHESHHTLHGCKSLGSFGITKRRRKATSKAAVPKTDDECVWWNCRYLAARALILPTYLLDMTHCNFHARNRCSSSSVIIRFTPKLHFQLRARQICTTTKVPSRLPLLFLFYYYFYYYFEHPGDKKVEV